MSQISATVGPHPEAWSEILLRAKPRGSAAQIAREALELVLVDLKQA